jgi:predicted aspartyl protease
MTGLVAAAGALGFSPLMAQTPPAPPSVSPAAAPDPPEPDASIATSTNRSEHVTAPILINGAGPFQFLVDTGANRSCIASALAARLGLPAGPPVMVHTSVGKRIRQTALVERLDIGPRSQKRVQAPLLPIPMQVDGVLGVDWLKGQRLVMDFKAKRLEITAPRSEVSQPDRVVVPARRRSGQLTIVDAAMGDVRINALIDSGAQISMGNEALRRRLGAQPAPGRGPLRVELVTVADERFWGDLLYAPFMRLGGLQLGNVPIVFTEVHVFELWKLTRVPTIVLGMDLLSEFDAVAMDYGKATVRFDVMAARRAPPVAA